MIITGYQDAKRFISNFSYGCISLNRLWSEWRALYAGRLTAARATTVVTATTIATNGSNSHIPTVNAAATVTIIATATGQGIDNIGLF